MHSRPPCGRAIYDGGPNGPRTLVYGYQQQLRADLHAKAAAEAPRASWWSACRSAIEAAVRVLLAPFDPGVPIERRPATVISYGRFVERRRYRNELGLLGLQQRILDAVAGHRLLSGTLDELATQLNTAVAPLREALRELRAIGWVAVQPRSDGQLRLCLERRHYAGPIPASGERRQAHGAGWPFYRRVAAGTQAPGASLRPWPPAGPADRPPLDRRSSPSLGRGERAAARHQPHRGAAGAG